MLKSQDVLVVCALAVHPQFAWGFGPVASASGLSQSASFRAVARLRAARLVTPDGFRVFDERLLNFLEHGVPYAFAVSPGKVARGMPTAHSAPPLSEHISARNAVVWPFAKGTVRGESLTPLAPSAPLAAQGDAALYQVLALVDALRIGRPRERKLAAHLLKEAFAHARLITEVS